MSRERVFCADHFVEQEVFEGAEGLLRTSVVPVTS